MKNRLLLLFLILSLVFNIFFIIGAIRHQQQRDPLHRIQAVARHLDLEPRQEELLSELRASYRESTSVIQQQIRTVRAQIADALDETNNNDDSRIQDLMARVAMLMTERRAIASSCFERFVDLLNPRQKRQLGRQLHRLEKDRRDSPSHTLRRFDADGDGQLNEQEQQHAEGDRQFHWNEAAKDRRKLRARFDLDHNGVLNPEEREAMRSWMLKRGIKPPQRGQRGSGLSPSANPATDEPMPPSGTF